MRYIAILILLFILLFIYLYTTNVLIISKNKKLTKRELEINGNEFTVEIAQNSINQMRGLSGRDSIKENEGMLFIFKTKRNRTFWMKGMKFPIDIIWINDKKIVKISHNIQPPNIAGKIISIKSESPIDRVLEISGGLSKKLKINTGNEIEINITRNEK